MNGKQFYVYIASNKNNSVFYTGVTNDLIRRMTEHRSKEIPGFTARYGIGRLLYYEDCNDPLTAIEREKQIKDMRRERKLELIQSMNPGLYDLFDTIIDE